MSTSTAAIFLLVELLVLDTKRLAHVEMKGALQRNCMSTSHFAAATIVTTVL